MIQRWDCGVDVPEDDGLWVRYCDHAAEVARLEELVPKWISVKERLPENTKAIIVWCPERANQYTAYWRFDEWWFFGGIGLLTEPVTHWIPLPSPPEAK